MFKVKIKWKYSSINTRFRKENKVYYNFKTRGYFRRYLFIQYTGKRQQWLRPIHSGK